MEADAREKPPEGCSGTESSCSTGEHRRGRGPWTRSSPPTTWSVWSHDRIYYCCCASGSPLIGNENPSSLCASKRASSGTRLGFSSSSTSSSSSSLDSDISLGCNRIMIPANVTHTSSESPTRSPCHRPSPCASPRSWRSRSWWASPWSSSRTSVTRKALTLLLVLLLGLTRADTCEDSELSRDCNDIEISAFHHLAFHQNCTTVEGRLHISDLDLPINITSWDDFGFPYLREITGHLRLKNLAGLQTLRQLFPNLAVIRGDALDEDKWALVVLGLPDLEELGLDTLTYIRNGAVKLKNNSHLCYYESIDWGRLAPTVNISDHYIMESNLTDNAPGHVCRESCSSSCPVTTYEGRRRGRCWSQGSDACQKHLGCTCPDGGFCADDGSCCHAECSGGCSGPLATDCVACKHLVYGDTCVATCPDKTYLFSEQHRCVSVSECQSIQPVRGKLPKIVESPTGGIGACTYHCPKGYMEDRSQGDDDVLRCIKCHGLCHIPCDGMKIQANVTKLQMLENCTVIEGSLEITLINYVSQETYKQYRFPNLREITGYLMLFRVFGLRSLRHMFPNLAVIKGQVQFYNNSLVIQEMRDLEEVGLISLTSIVNGSVFMSNNYRLCFVSTVDWGAIAQGVDPSSHHFMKNRGSEMCHDACSDKCQFSTYEGSNRKRCWTSMDDGCQRNLKPCNCKREGKLCGPNKECCHSYCLGGCTGPKQSDCLACKDVRWKSKCVPTCPRGTFMLAKCRCLTDKECLKLKQQDFDPKLLKGFGKQQPSQCLYECPAGYREDILPGLKKATRCLKCVNGFCPKVCNENPKVFNIRDTVKFRGCSKLVGNLDLHLTGGDDIDTELRQNFGAIQEITGYLRVMGANPLLSLHFFENLQVIGGERLANKQYSLLIMGNYNLERLFNHSTTKKLVIHQGEVALHNNRKLCPSHIVELMTELQENRLRHNMTDEIIFDFNNNTNGDLMPCHEIVMSLEIMKIEATNVNIRWSSYQTGEFRFKNNTFPTGDNRHALQYIFFYQKSQENNTDIYKGRDACTQLNWKEWRVSMNNNNSVLPHLDPFTRYALFIKADILPTAQGSARSPVVYFTTKPDKPTEPTGLEVASISPSKLEISWKPPKSPNGIIHDYKVFYTLQKFNAAKFEQRDYCQDPINKQAEEEAKVKKQKEEKEQERNRDQSQNCCECPIDGDRDKDGRELEVAIAFQNYLIGVSYLKLPTCGNFTRRENVAINNDKFLNETTTTTAPRGLNGSETTDIIESLLKFMNGSANETIDYLLANATTDENSTSASNLANNTLEAKNSTEPELDPALVTREVIVRGNRITLGDLEHFSYYDIAVVACHDYDHKTGRKLCGDNNTSARKTVQTKSYAPYDDINTANISAVPSTTKIGDVFIYWQPPAKPNGIILKYTIKYKKVTTESTANYEMRCISRQQYKQIKGYKLENLEPGNYSYQINAHSLSDNGSFTQELFFTVAAVAGPDSDKVDMLLLVIVLVVAVFTCIIIVVCWRLRAKYIKFTDTVSSNPHYMHTDDIYSADEWEVDREDIRLIKELGQGSFGMVFEGIMENKEQGTSTRVAIKTVNEQADFIERWKILKEATTMKVFECHHVVKLLGVVSKSQPALVILELMALGDLRNYLRRCREEEEDYPDYHPPSSNKIRQMAGEIADGMAYLADKKIVHRDLAARNCLVAEDTTVKIADFGMARDVYMTEYYRKDQRALLPIRWMAPESLHDGVFTTMSDIWSYGVVLWEMVTLAEQPYQGLGNEQVLKYVTEGYIMGETEGCPEDLFQIMKMCWAFHPRKRPTFKWIIEMLVPYISSRFHKVSYFFQEVAHSDPEDTGDDLNLNSEDNSGDEYIGVNRREGNEREEEREMEDDDEYDEEDRVGFEEEKLIKGDHDHYPGASGNDDANAVGYPVTSLSPTASCQVRLMPMSGAKKYYNAPIDHHAGAKPFKGKQNSPPSERGSLQQQPLLHPASPASSYASSKDRHRHLANSPNRRSMGDGGDDDGDSLDAAADIDADDGGHFDRGLMDSLHIDEDDSSPEHFELAVLLPKRQQPADSLSPPGSRPEQHPSSSNLNCSSRPSAVANPKSNEDSLYTMMTRPVSKNKPPPSSSPLSSSSMPLSPKSTALFSPSSPTVPSTSSLSSSLSSPSSPPPATTVTSKSPSSSHPAHSAAKTTSHSPSHSFNVNPPHNTSPMDPTSNPSYSSAQQAKSKPTLEVTTEDHHLRNVTPSRGSNSGRERQPGGGGMGDNAGGSGWHDAFQNNKSNARSRNKFGGGGNCAVLPNDYNLYSDSSDVDSVNSSSRNPNSEGSGSKESSSSSGSRHHMPQANGHGPYSHQQAALC